LPNHLAVWRGGELVAAAPLYVKGHSYGEFVFDSQWADFAARSGINYYPKLLGMSPITPAEGYRFLISPNEDEREITALMLAEIDGFCKQYKISGCHFLFVDPTWKEVMLSMGFSEWLHHSYVWQNREYQNFDDYLAVFNCNQRRNIKRERKAVDKAGLKLNLISGDRLTLADCQRMYAFYADTCDKFGYWGSKYLTPEFFDLLYEKDRDRVLLFAATRVENSEPVGMSFCLRKGDRLYGRYWGSFEAIDCLHFDACYYTPIEWAIANNIQQFDPGAGGRHKKRRGFPATPNYSLHRFYYPSLNRVLLPYIREVNQLESNEIAAINSELPFKDRSLLDEDI
jgi:predicted N-acyltransferase